MNASLSTRLILSGKFALFSGVPQCGCEPPQAQSFLGQARAWRRVRRTCR